MKSAKFSSMSLVLLVIYAIPVLAYGNLINGSFEISPAIPGGSSFVTERGGSTAITGWTVTGNTIDVFGPSWVVSDGSRAIDLDGAFSTGGIQQSFSTVAGKKYNVSFDLSGNPEGSPIIKQAAVSVGSFMQNFSYDPSGQTRGTLIWQPVSFEFMASSTSETLSFQSLSPAGNSWGAFIDNVSVSLNTPGSTIPVPVPSTLFLFSSGLASLIGWQYRKKHIK